MTQPLTPAQEQWLSDLESGAFLQGKGCLCDGNNYCCLGVYAQRFCETLRLPIYRKELSSQLSFNGMSLALSIEMSITLGLKDPFGTIIGFYENVCDSVGCCTSLAAANDIGFTFKQIAEFCRNHPESVFRA